MQAHEKANIPSGIRIRCFSREQRGGEETGANGRVAISLHMSNLLTIKFLYIAITTIPTTILLLPPLAPSPSSYVARWASPK